MNMMNRIAGATSSSAMALALIATFAMPTAATAQDTAPQEAAEDDAGGGEIIVTARKRAEDILKTPVSLSALTSEDISKRGIVSLNDVVNNTPGINISNTSSGRNDRSFQQIALRGFVPTTATSVLTATFIDGVPVASATALNSISDPERIEILKGPQAAYFGRNTFAGAVNVVNKLPGADLGGSVSAMRGTRNNFDVQGAIEGPLFSDMLSFRLTGRSFSKDGSYTNGANLNQTLGDQRTDTGTLLLVAKPSDSLTIKGFGLLSKDNDGPSAQGQLSAYEIRAGNSVRDAAGNFVLDANGNKIVESGILNIPFNQFSTAPFAPRAGDGTVGTVIVPNLSNCNLTGFTAGRSATEARVVRPYICGAAPRPAAGFSPAQNTVEDRLLAGVLSNGAFRAVTPEQGVQGYGLKRRYYHLHLNVDYEVGDTGITLSSLTGYNNEYYSELADLDNYDSSLLRNPANLTGANQNLRTFWDFPFIVERTTRDFSQELRAAYDNGGPFQGVIGASYLLTKSDSDLVSAQGQIVGGIARPSTTRQPPQKSKTTGLFFGLTYELTEQLKISAEGRYQEDKIFAFTGGSAAGLVVNANNQYGLTAGTFGPLTNFFTKSFKKFLPRVIVQYEFDNDLMAYASYSKGANISLSSFNTSFLNGSPTVVAAAEALDLGVIVQPEVLDNYELGLKGKLLDGRVRFSLAAYYAQWTAQHNTRSTLVFDAPTAGCPAALPFTCVAQIVSGVANSGDVDLMGIELDVTATPVDNLDINFSAAMNESDIKNFADPSISLVTGVIDGGFKGNQLPSTSKYSANLGVQYGMEINAWDEGSWFIRGDLSYKSKQFADAANLTWIASRTLVDFRAGVTKDAFSLEAFVRNAFNNKDYISIANNSLLVPDFSISNRNGYLNVGLPELRTFGVKGSFKF